MAPLIDTRYRDYRRLYWLITLLLVSFFWLLPAAWDFITTNGFKPAEIKRFAIQNSSLSNLVVKEVASSGKGDPLTPVTSTSTFMPFLDVVPSEDGRELFVSAGGVGQVDGTVVVSVSDEGPGHRKGSWTMTYSSTTQIYITTVTGFTPNTGTFGSLSITTTLGLDTGTVDFNRTYVPTSTVQTINSIDGILQLTLVSTDTFPSDTYVAVTPSFAPPGPAPLGHRFIGSTYSIRASGAILVADRPMNLILAYDTIVLAGADPHTLAIFAWNAFNKRWDNLGGTLFSDQKFVSVPINHFTTYALMTTSTWRDKFDDLSGLEINQSSNINLGGTPENRTLILADIPGSGHAVSKPVIPPTTFADWGTVSFNQAAAPPTTTLTVDILSLDGALLLTNVASGTSLAGLIDPTAYPGLRLRANLASAVSGESSTLKEWTLSWQVKEQVVYLPLVLK